MRIQSALAVAAVCLSGLLGNAWASTDVEASRACVKCHDDEDLPDMRKSAHAMSADKRTPNCITCHGPSPTHVDKPSDAKERPAPDRVFSKNAGLHAADRSAVCQDCHDRDSKRSLWAGSQHAAADVSCTSCHKVHTNSDRVLAKADQAAVCYSCHKEQRVQVSRPSRHPIPEGKMTCADCHNVHGSTGPKLVKRDNTNDTCFSCHAEKRGPFVHSHQPVVEDCSNCHNPHGSTIAAMLTARPPMLCQQCHTPHVAGDLGALGGQPGVFSPVGPGQGPLINSTSSGKNVVNMWQGRSCMNCHTQVHGSNNPAATNPAPHRLLR